VLYQHQLIELFTVSCLEDRLAVGLGMESLGSYQSINQINTTSTSGSQKKIKPKEIDL